MLVQGEEVTLMAWGNAIIDTVEKCEATGNILSAKATLHLDGDFKKTKLKLTWLSDTQDLAPLELHYFGYLITKKKLEEDDTFEEFVNRNSERVTIAVGDMNMKSMKKGDILQLERKGYYIIDVPYDANCPTKPIVLFDIPDGRAKPLIQ